MARASGGRPEAAEHAPYSARHMQFAEAGIPAHPMRAMRRQPLPAVAASLGVAGLIMALLVAGVPIAPLQSGAADALLVREGGPRLGRRPALPEVLLVELDAPSARRLGLPVRQAAQSIENLERLPTAMREANLRRMAGVWLPEQAKQYRSGADV